MIEFLQLLINGLAAGSIYGLVALGFVLIYKATEMVNFAQGDLMMLGAFVAYTVAVDFGMSYWAALIAAVVVLAVFGFVLDAVVLRQVIGKPQFSVVMLTIGLGFLMRSGASIAFGSDMRQMPTPFDTGVTRVGGLMLSDVSLAVVIGTAILCLALYLFFSRTRLGVAMQAASQNQLAAYYMGVPVKFIFSLIWAISAGVAAVAGVLLAPIALIDVGMGLIGIKAFAAAVLGGFGSIPGAVVGGLIIGVIEQLSAIYMGPGFKDVAAQVVLLGVLCVWPQGLFGRHARKKV